MSELYSYKRPRFNDQGKILALTYTVSRDSILAEYWDFWKSKMIEKYGESSEKITEDNCIDDWCLIYRAEKVN